MTFTRSQAECLSVPKDHIGGLIELTKHALDVGDVDFALRLTDRAIRVSHNNHHLTVLRGTTLLKAGRPAQAIEQFSKLVSTGDNPDGAIGLAYAHLALGDFAAAADLARGLTGQFDFGQFPMIAPLLRRVCRALGPACPGWVSMSSDGRIVGAVSSLDLDRNESLVVADAVSGRILANMPIAELSSETNPADSDDGFLDFSLALKATDWAEPSRVSIGNSHLIGSPVCAPSASRIEGFVDRDANRITGWVALIGHPLAQLTIRLVCENGLVHEVASSLPPIDDIEPTVEVPIRQTFSIDLAAIGLDATRVEVWGWLPAMGVGNQLSGSPLGGAVAGIKVQPSAKSLIPRKPNRKISVDIIIPIYDGLAETLACLKSVIASLPFASPSVKACEVIVINDRTPDSNLRAALEDLAADRAITLLNNERNLGFPISVNRGLALHPDRDVIVLNSDTMVFGDWIARLKGAAYSDANIGTVTPFSNEASILSYPMSLGDNPIPPAEDGALLDRLASEFNAGLTIDIPTAVGFCMYIRRDCLDAVGLFDVAVFGRGYGEENDFCMRAFEAGWRNIAAPNIFVGHIGSRSFGPSKKMLVARNTAILNTLHPGYDALVRDFIARDPLSGARRNIDIARLRRSISGPVVLLVTLGLGGGVARNVREAAVRHAGQGMTPLVLRPLQGSGSSGKRAEIAHPFDETLCNIVFDLPDEIGAVQALLTACGVARLEIHHVLGLDPSILALADRLGVAYDIMLHDYSWLCPRVNLVDGRGRYCGLPMDTQICERCVSLSEAAIEETILVEDLRRRSVKLLNGAGRVVAACEDVVDHYGLFAPDAQYEITPWEDAPLFVPADIRRAQGARIRIAVIGGIGEQKGYDILLACARDAAIRDLPIEFVVIGYTSDDFALFKTGRVFVTGRYADDEALDLIQAQSCQLAFLPSISPETWSYTLTLAWQAGLEVLAFDFGAIAERIRGYGHGHVMPFTKDETAINRVICGLVGAQLDQTQRKDSLDIIRHEDGAGAFVASIGGNTDSDRSSLETLLSLQPGLYAFSLADAVDADIAKTLTVQVSATADNMPDSKVDFLGTHDPVENWLTGKGDVVIVRITGSARSLLIKTMRLPGESLADVTVECRRLDRIEDATKSLAPLDGSGALRTQITMHVQNRGDLPFIGPAWAGCMAEKLWVEAFTINPLEGFSPRDIEYKGLTRTGFETPWIAGGAMCGTRGTSNPLIAFAIRLRGASAERYLCRYRGAFLGSGVVGPFRDGAACKSRSGRDPLAGIELEIVERTEADLMDDVVDPQSSVPEYEIVYGSY